jgi:predicted RNA-binding Zn-ribbon protein involved in translation (DUF1610 family)
VSGRCKSGLKSRVRKARPCCRLMKGPFEKSPREELECPPARGREGWGSCLGTGVVAARAQVISNTAMSNARIEPDRPDHDKRTFECPNCGNEHSEVVKFGLCAILDRHAGIRQYEVTMRSPRAPTCVKCSAPMREVTGMLPIGLTVKGTPIFRCTRCKDIRWVKRRNRRPLVGGLVIQGHANS